ncbi:hypothetical protein [Streptomyces thermodiastaticus]|uniref:hypothetical protein n=1 Tax=Streptomyces thermodiastaticus TaxID=44061 RepID=UPI0019A83070|nr:hypothetical protein [Streptomyces thermodiastaticus]MCE7553402.1 hypothetical protein [Streptomyces thermodiastaticus]GHE24215.1 hypothetical protein GCM10018787_53670 [Streptomyces thermodiastaticus]
MPSHSTPPTSPKRRRVIGTLLAAAAAGVLTWLAVPGGSSPAAAGTDARAAAPVADEGPGYAVEDFAYPQADKIREEKGIVLKRGDGHITLADCVSGTGQLEVWARANGNQTICFEVTGTSGWLTLEIPSVYGIRGNDYTTEVDMTTGTEHKSFDIEKNNWTPVGETADEQGRQFMLVEIRTSK